VPSDLDPTGENGSGRVAHRREAVSGEAVLMVVDGKPPVVGDGEGVADAKQKMTLSSNSWLMAAMASRGDAGG
jgi:hypothetical protein